VRHLYKLTKSKNLSNSTLIMYVGSYDENTKILRIPSDVNEILKNFPTGVKTLIFEEASNYVRQPSQFNKPVGNLPDSLIEIIFGYSFNQPINNLPDSITHLTFGQKFNQPVDNLPKNLTHLTFGDLFDKLVDNLPPNLTHLTFGDGFNQPVEHLPQNLTHLSFGSEFNCGLDSLPKNLTYLTVGARFDKDIKNIPKTIIEFAFDVKSNVKNNIPEFIETVTIYSTEAFNDKKCNSKTIVSNLPSTIKQINVRQKDLPFLNKIPFGCVVVYMNDSIIKERTLDTDSTSDVDELMDIYY